MTIKGENDIQKAIYLLREIEAYLCINPQPVPSQVMEIKKSIMDFTKHFPQCLNCWDNGYIKEGVPCDCNESDKLCVI